MTNSRTENDVEDFAALLPLMTLLKEADTEGSQSSTSMSLCSESTEKENIASPLKPLGNREYESSSSIRMAAGPLLENFAENFQRKGSTGKLGCKSVFKPLNLSPFIFDSRASLSTAKKKNTTTLREYVHGLAPAKRFESTSPTALEGKLAKNHTSSRIKKDHRKASFQSRKRARQEKAIYSRRQAAKDTFTREREEPFNNQDCGDSSHFSTLAVTRRRGGKGKHYSQSKALDLSDLQEKFARIDEEFLQEEEESSMHLYMAHHTFTARGLPPEDNIKGKEAVASGGRQGAQDGDTRDLSDQGVIQRGSDADQSLSSVEYERQSPSKRNASTNRRDFTQPDTNDADHDDSNSHKEENQACEQSDSTTPQVNASECNYGVAASGELMLNQKTGATNELGDKAACNQKKDSRGKKEKSKMPSPLAATCEKGDIHLEALAAASALHLDSLSECEDEAVGHGSEPAKVISDEGGRVPEDDWEEDLVVEIRPDDTPHQESQKSPPAANNQATLVAEEATSMATPSLVHSSEDVASPPSSSRVKRRPRPRTKQTNVGNPMNAGTEWKKGQRLSTRIKCKPLEYWRGEKMLYGRVHSSLCTLIGIKTTSPDPLWPKPKPSRGDNRIRNFHVDSFVDAKYNDMIRLAAL